MLIKIGMLKLEFIIEENNINKENTDKMIMKKSVEWYLKHTIKTIIMINILQKRYILLVNSFSNPAYGTKGIIVNRYI